MTRVWIGSGSNLGNRNENLQFALNQLEGAGFQPEAVSSVYSTVPQGSGSQPRFLNQVVRGLWGGTAGDLLPLLKRIEKDAGRVGGPRWGPRILDLDILLSGIEGQEIVRDPELEIPHPRIVERAFVLVPLSELDPGLSIPETGRTVCQLLKSLGEWSHLVEKCPAPGGDEPNR
ncbi:MAG: 2-amino-4-hydroxy-6-hydroxymethyldihydropteridine diphosphokinase [Candidatus Eisenbacteria bacterium]|uniref:2-amino-4-hydroxy-6-hydroxymethyldihydropteridine diphosphokinase n=1 Tax=Eiseniibacteriota bacterium TaxID=2212470 RepID=A0A948RTV6_UNCEI|nr:2-amino-4-hydroxy-6-hydroxymethyldihydropteridine diphosphokinase [Candidatus Eisenbacteria bacterium]MBU1951276.1 2-amino-4-hydroxy-6-hydroxymethyldihydropteridine diphosphokinase [Candidatus Eisenbacteria bacterium]MBU2689624.1 2-amino-4-hydroxy-6-hydroxymethyldihydropteridine diphosphokinase [Candidatus Eisenbacteria bacterium]